MPDSRSWIWPGFSWAANAYGFWVPEDETADVLVLGASYYPTDNVRLYAETGWAYQADGGSEPWEFQFGLDFSPAAPTGAPRGSIVGRNVIFIGGRPASFES